jgi:hypothetical protein
MARFTGTYYADLARLRIEDLREQSEAQTIAPPSNGPASPSGEEDIGNRMDGLKASRFGR